MLERFLKKTSLLVLFVAVILSYASFAGIGFIKGVVVLEVN